MTAGPVPSSQGWIVTSQTETTDLAPDGTFRQGVKVSFRLDDGTVGSVFLTDDRYNVDNVRMAIKARAAELSAIAAMTHEG